MAGLNVYNLEYFTPSLTKGPQLPEFSKGKGRATDGPKNSISQFFKSMFETCRDARAYSHEARELAKETRCIQNADRRATGLLTTADGPELAPTEYVERPMPEISNADFYYHPQRDMPEEEEPLDLDHDIADDEESEESPPSE